MVMLTAEPRLRGYKLCCNHSRGEVLNRSPSLQYPGWMWHPPDTYRGDEGSHWGFASSISLWEGSQETGPLVAIKCSGPNAVCLWLPWFEERYGVALNIFCSSLSICYWSLSRLWCRRALTHSKEFLQPYTCLPVFLQVSLHFDVSPGCSVCLSRHHFFCIYVATYPGSQQWINHYVHSLSWERYWLIDSSPGGQELVCYLIRLNFIWSCPRCQEWFNELTSWTMKVGAQLCATAQETQFVCLIGLSAQQFSLLQIPAFQGSTYSEEQLRIHEG